MGRTSAAGLALCVSLLVHASVMLLLQQLDEAPPPAPQAFEIPFSVEPTQATASPQDVAAARTPRAAPVIIPGGPVSFSNLDRDTFAGRSGDGASPEPAILLFPFSANLTLQDTDLNNLARNQAQRIQTARDRATQEERRATPSAGDAVFLASGDEGHHERRKASARDSASGVQTGSQPSQQGKPPTHGLDPADTAPTLATANMGAKDRKIAQGVLRARGKVAKRSARVAFARPNVDRGPAATTAEVQDARIRDDIDAELLAAQLQRSLVDASMARGERLAAGHGGLAAHDDGSASATHGEGAHALPYAPGDGTDGALDTRDGRYIRWFIEQKARVQAGVVFPFARALAKDQGTSVYRVIVTRAGTLAGPMQLVRSSGYADFDAAAQAAIRHAAPFAPLPRELMHDAEQLAILIPIAFANPMVE